VFARLLFAFELSKADERVVGLNLIAPEDDFVALENYDRQMSMLDFLWQRWPQMNISLHAGELTLGMVRFEDLRTHIRLAVEKGHARRIGHGVTIGYEDDAFGPLSKLKQGDVLVEVNLTSNEQLLGVKGPDHPFLDYRRAGVPITLSTDDEGITRTDLTNEYFLAARAYRLNYEDIKTLVRNSISHSFMPGDSLWLRTSPTRVIAACADELPGGASPSFECTELL
jgi:adenosine deaminase/adenosine deaminase CECR1